MATTLSIVGPLTTLPDDGKLEFGEVNLGVLTVGELKHRIKINAAVDVSSQKLWWRGYVLDNDDLPLTEACIGVNKGEVIEKDATSLILFMTEENANEDDGDPSKYTSNFNQRLRSLSFDIDKVRIDITKKKEHCIIL